MRGALRNGLASAGGCSFFHYRVAPICLQSLMHSLRGGTSDLSFKGMTRLRGPFGPKNPLAPEHRGPRAHHLRGTGRAGYRAGPVAAFHRFPYRKRPVRARAFTASRKVRVVAGCWLRPEEDTANANQNQVTPTEHHVLARGAGPSVPASSPVGLPPANASPLPLWWPLCRGSKLVVRDASRGS